MHVNSCYPGPRGPKIKFVLPLLLKALISEFSETCSVIPDMKHTEECGSSLSVNFMNVV
jgi:hypothetical protein